jgi:hypothetical protein
MPPRTSAAPTCPWYLCGTALVRVPFYERKKREGGTYWKRYCLSIVIAVATSGGRPVESS